MAHLPCRCCVCVYPDDAKKIQSGERVAIFLGLVILAQVAILLRHHVSNVNARMLDGTTPLILAARLAMEETIEELINANADINAPDDYGKCGKIISIVLVELLVLF